MKLRGITRLLELGNDVPSISKLVALFIAVLWVVLALAGEPRMSVGVAKLCGVLLLSLVLIGFPDELGNFTGYIGWGRRIDTETPSILVSFFGWLLLLGLPAVVFWTS